MNKNQYMTTKIKNNDQRNTSLLKAQIRHRQCTPKSRYTDCLANILNINHKEGSVNFKKSQNQGNNDPIKKS